MNRTLTALAAATLLCATPATATASPHAHRSQASNPVIDWNRYLLTLQATPGVQPATVHPTYELAIMHEAIDQAVQRDRLGSPEAAADAAAHDTLVKLYPAQQAQIEQQYVTELAMTPGGLRRLVGVAVGQQVAREVLASRRGDGADAPPVAFTPGTNPGDYQLTPPGFAAPQFTQWGNVRPFVLRSPSQYRPPAPPAVNSPKAIAAMQEVQRLGSATNSTRTDDQTQIGLFWNPPIWATWNRIAQTAVLGHAGTLQSDAHAFALLDETFADSVIAFYDAKYTYRLWRPVTEIRALADPNWTPLSNTANDPSYPGAHGTISAAGADVLSSLYGNDFSFTVDSTALPGVLRSFSSFTEAAEEASVSRIYNGNHTRIDQVAGENLGHDVAAFVLTRER